MLHFSSTGNDELGEKQNCIALKHLDARKSIISHINFMQTSGIEPEAIAWKAIMLPLHHACVDREIAL
jgi:hypothetical protein